MANLVIPATYPATHFVEANPQPDWIALMAVFFVLLMLSIGFDFFYRSMKVRRVKAITHTRTGDGITCARGLPRR